jgi:hypothetical protein
MRGTKLKKPLYPDMEAFCILKDAEHLSDEDIKKFFEERIEQMEREQPNYLYRRSVFSWAGSDMEIKFILKRKIVNHGNGRFISRKGSDPEDHASSGKETGSTAHPE